jgi:hypothetical protein
MALTCSEIAILIILVDDLLAFMFDKNLPVDEIEAGNIAGEILRNPPLQGFLTISNALQWRLQYGRVIERAWTTGRRYRSFINLTDEFQRSQNQTRIRGFSDTAGISRDGVSEIDRT